MFAGVSEAAGRVRLVGGWASTGSVPRASSAATVTGEVSSEQGAVSTTEAMFRCTGCSFTQFRCYSDNDTCVSASDIIL